MDKLHPIIVRIDDDYKESFSDDDYKGSFSADGKMDSFYDGECILFPSREQRDWSKFKVKKPKFDPMTLKPFEKILVRDYFHDEWVCNFFSHIIKDGEDRCP